MNIAIVTGGVDGVRDQMRIWRAEDIVRRQKQALAYAKVQVEASERLLREAEAEVLRLRRQG